MSTMALDHRDEVQTALIFCGYQNWKDIQVNFCVFVEQCTMFQSDSCDINTIC